MAETNFKPEFTVFKTESDAFNSITENRDLIRKNDIRRLHGNRTDAAPIHPRAKTQEGSSACYEIFSRVDCKYLPPLAVSGSKMQVLLTACLSKSG